MTEERLIYGTLLEGLIVRRSGIARHAFVAIVGAINCVCGGLMVLYFPRRHISCQIYGCGGCNGTTLDEKHRMRTPTTPPHLTVRRRPQGKSHRDPGVSEHKQSRPCYTP
jgi:hypothetical protein